MQKNQQFNRFYDIIGGEKIFKTEGFVMYKIDKKKYFAVLLCVNVMGYVMSAPAAWQDPDLDLNRHEALVEAVVRRLEEDLSRSQGYGKCIPEEDRLLISIKVRDHVNMMSDYDLRHNPGFVRAETGKVLVNFVQKRAYAHAITTMGNVKLAENAASSESNLFISLFRNNPSRDGYRMYHYFGETFEKRVKENAMNGKYSY